jgi:hypothetical protein
MSFDLGAYSNFGALTFNPTTSGGTATIGSTLTVSTLIANIVDASTINTSTLNAYDVNTNLANAVSINTSTISTTFITLQGLPMYYSYTSTYLLTNSNPFSLDLPFAYSNQGYSVIAQYEAEPSALTAAQLYPVLCSTTGVSTFVIWSLNPVTIPTPPYVIKYITCGTLPSVF